MGLPRTKGAEQKGGDYKLPIPSPKDAPYVGKIVGIYDLGNHLSKKGETAVSIQRAALVVAFKDSAGDLFEKIIDFPFKGNDYIPAKDATFISTQFKLYSAIVGHPIELGEEIGDEDLLGKPVMVSVKHDPIIEGGKAFFSVKLERFTGGRSELDSNGRMVFENGVAKTIQLLELDVPLLQVPPKGVLKKQDLGGVAAKTSTITALIDTARTSTVA